MTRILTVAMRYTSLLALCALKAHAIYSQIAPAQLTSPSNLSSDLFPVATSPRFLLEGTEFPDLPTISLAPVGPYATSISKSEFQETHVPGHLMNVNVVNPNTVSDWKTIFDYVFAYISCDPEAYSGYLDASNALSTIFYSGSQTVVVILYSIYSNHCNVSGLANASGSYGVLTTVNPMAASALAKLNLGVKSNGSALLFPDLNSFTNSSGSNNSGPSATTAMAMIILYSITGIITALFIIIIITGAIRVHRHPERYLPRVVAGRMRQSRAKGIARAMLETLPIVKFGDHEDLPAKRVGQADVDTDSTRDVEMTPTTVRDTTTAPPTEDKAISTSSALVNTTSTPHNGTTEDGTLGCSICTEDFSKGEEVRVLPCNHKFHPDCVDPWLLNVSGTCPLCRIDLRPEEERNQEEVASQVEGESSFGIPPPMSLFEAGRRGTHAAGLSLRGVVHGTADERIAALRRYRAERRRNTVTNAAGSGTGEATPAEREGEAESKGVTARLRDRFKVITRRAGTGAV
jgi:hypothetical protein